MLLRRTSLRLWLITAMCLVALIPALSLSYLLADRGAEQREERSAERMVRLGSFLGRSVEGFIEKHELAVAQVARSVGHNAEFGDDARLPQMLAFHRRYPNFKSTISTDGAATLTSATFREGEIPNEWTVPVQSVADRQYFQVPRDSGEPYVSDVFAGRGTGEEVLIVAISAPILRSDGRFAGIVEGTLELTEFEHLFAAEELPAGLEVALVDQRRRLIQQSAGLGLNPLATLDQATWTRTGNAAAKDHHPFITAAAPAGHGWTVLLRLPVDVIADQRWSEFRFALAWAAIALIVTIYLAILLANVISRPLNWLDDKVRALDPEQEVPDPPAVTPPEIRRIATHLREVTQRLRGSYAALQLAVDRGEKLRTKLAETVREREAQIAERTADLRAANTRLEALSRQDGLTGTLNRRALDQALADNVQAAVRERTPLSVLLIDVDYFKQYNDRYGHLAGDDCLRRIASALTETCVRPRDVVARYGGEEFAAILPLTKATGAAEVAERVRDAIAAQQLPHEGSPLGVVTVSVGHATGTPGELRDGASLLAVADQALYAAKRMGRNQTHDGEALDALRLASTNG